jgi:RHS repeat-associated protein
MAKHTITVQANGMTYKVETDADTFMIGGVEFKFSTPTFTFTDDDQVSTEQPPSGAALQYFYRSSDGKFDYKIDRNSRTLSMHYDNAGRLDRESYVDESNQPVQVLYTYGGPGRRPDHLASVTDETGRTEFNYGHRGRLTQQRNLALHRQQDFTYDEAGHLLTLTLTDTSGLNPSVSETYHYDALGRNDQLTDFHGNEIHYGYDAAGHETKVEYHAKRGSTLKHIATGRFLYDAAGRLLEMAYRKGSSSTGPLLAKVAYTYDKAGNRLSRTTLGSQATYTYNTLNELLSDANGADIRGDQSFTYDAAGNRSTQGIGGQTRTYDHSNTLNQLEGYSGVGSASFGYDAEGNRTTAPGTGYAWDGKNRLKQVTISGGPTVSYSYDYMNRMLSRTKGSEVQTSLYGSGIEVLEEMAQGKRVSVNGWGADGLVTKTDADGHTRFLLKDGLSSVVGVLDEKAALVQSREYSAYGEALGGKDSVDAFGFVGGMGGRADDATGLVYFWNRWYEAGSGLWMSEDPIRQSGGSNLLLYVSGNPVTHVDFRGLAEILIDIYQMQGFAPEAFYKGTRLPVPTDQLRIFKFDKDSGYRYKNSTDDTYLFHRDGYDDAKGRFAPHIESSNPDPLPEGYFRRLWEQTRRALEIGPVPCDPKNIVNGGPIRG